MKSFQRSAVSFQLLKQPGQHAFQLGRALRQFRVVLGLDELHHRPEKTAKPPAKIEAAYHSADAAIQKLVDLIAA